MDTKMAVSVANILKAAVETEIINRSHIKLINIDVSMMSFLYGT